MNFSLTNTTRARLPNISWQALTRRALASSYVLSVVICADALSRTLNNKYRAKNKPANVLSFPLSKTSGEIFLNIKQASREARLYERTQSKHLEALFIHGLAHLRGLSHGKKMEVFEARLLSSRPRIEN